jgi:hypothetical protein
MGHNTYFLSSDMDGCAMTTFLRRAGWWAAIAVVWQVGGARAEDDYLASVAGSDGLCAVAEPCPVFYADFRTQQTFNSHTSYEFGTPPGYPFGQWAPLSRLDWSLDATWIGLRVGMKKPTWDAHFEWLMPVVWGTYGDMSDYDWGITPPYDPSSLDSLSVSPQRWIDGQKIELEEECLWTDRFLGMPIEFWPLAGFRWQRFDMMAYNGLQVINNGPPPSVGYRWTEDMGSFNQQYYMAYLGGQLRKTFYRDCRPPITLTLQVDYGVTAGYNVDHHISGYEAMGIHRYTMESTGGDALHLAVIGDVPFNDHVSIGVQADHLQIRTTGSHRWFESGAATQDMTWSNGVAVQSEQTSVAAYLRYCW